MPIAANALSRITFAERTRTLASLDLIVLARAVTAIDAIAASPPITASKDVRLACL